MNKKGQKIVYALIFSITAHDLHLEQSHHYNSARIAENLTLQQVRALNFNTWAAHALSYFFVLQNWIQISVSILDNTSQDKGFL